MRQHRIAGRGEPLSEEVPGREEGRGQLRTARDDPGKGCLRVAHAPFEVLAVHRGTFRGTTVKGMDGPEEVENEAAGAPVRLRRFSPGLVETGRRGPEEPLAPPEEREQSGEGERRGPEEPRVERSPEDFRLPPGAGLETGQQLEHARAALGKVPEVGRRRFEGSGQSPGSVQLLRGGIEPCVEVREPDMRGGSESRRRGRERGRTGNLRRKRSPHLSKDLQQLPRAVEAVRFREAGPADQFGESSRREGQGLRLAEHPPVSAGKGVGDPFRALPESLARPPKRLELRPEVDDPRPLALKGVDPRGEAGPLGLQRPLGRETGVRFRGNAGDELERAGAQRGNAGVGGGGGRGGRRGRGGRGEGGGRGGGNRPSGEVLRQARGRPRDASLLAGDGVSTVGLDLVFVANERDEGENGNAAQEGEPADEREERSSRSRGVLRGRRSARGRGR